jgi:hypothetical protein
MSGKFWAASSPPPSPPTVPRGASVSEPDSQSFPYSDVDHDDHDDHDAVDATDTHRRSASDGLPDPDDSTHSRRVATASVAQVSRAVRRVERTSVRNRLLSLLRDAAVSRCCSLLGKGGAMHAWRRQ